MPSTLMMIFTKISPALVLRLVLGTILLYYGIYKLRDRRAFNHVLRSLVANESIRAFIAIAVPLIETVLGSLLLFNVGSAFVTGCVEGLLIAFSIVVWYGWQTKKIDECGCGRASTPPWMALARNGLLLLIGAGLLWHADTTTFSSQIITVEGVLALIIVLIALVGSYHSYQGLQQHGSPSSTRRNFLVRGVAFGVAALIPLFNPLTSLAFSCDCSCDGGWYEYGPCNCGIQEVYFVELPICCNSPDPNVSVICGDPWTLAKGFIEC